MLGVGVAYILINSTQSDKCCRSVCHPTEVAEVHVNTCCYSGSARRHVELRLEVLWSEHGDGGEAEGLGDRDHTDAHEGGVSYKHPGRPREVHQALTEACPDLELVAVVRLVSTLLADLLRS